MPRTVRELAAALNAQIEGDASAIVSGLAAPESARAEDLIYADSPRHAERAARSAARCVLVPPDIQLPGKTLLRVDHPKLAFAKAAAWLESSAEGAEQGSAAPQVHPTAVVSPSAKIARGVAIGPYAVIEDDVSIGAGTSIGAFVFLGRGANIGDHCRLDPRVTLYAGTRLGHRVTVHAGTVIASDGFGYVFGEGRHWKFPQLGTVEIGDDVEIGSNVTIDRGSLGVTRIAAGTKLDNLVHVAHNVQIGEHSVIAAQTGISGSSVVGNHVVIGGQVGIADHSTIEDAAQVGAQAGIPTGKTIRTGQTVWGTPARPLDKFKQQYAWFSRLPDLAARLRALERKLAGG